MTGLNIEKLKFKKKLFGIDEADVLKKIMQLNKEYQAIVEHQKNEYEEELNKKDELIKSLNERLN